MCVCYIKIKLAPLFNKKRAKFGTNLTVEVLKLIRWSALDAKINFFKRVINLYNLWNHQKTRPYKESELLLSFI